MKHATSCRASKRAALCSAALLVLASQPAAAAGCAAPRPGSFRVYQALLYEGMPDLRANGIEPVHVVDRDFWRGDPRNHTPDPAKIRAVVAALPKDGAPIVLDIESLDLRRRAPAIGTNVRLLASIAASFKAAAPKRAIGYYGIFPLADYWRVLDEPKGAAAEWRQDNDAAAALRSRIDYVFPSLYTHYRDQAGWVKQARAVVCEARRVSGKPVYAFIWPEFHDGSHYAGEAVPADFWRLQLRTLHEIADGVVIWGGHDLKLNRPRRWTGTEAWWRVTTDEMKQWRSQRR